MLLSFHPLSLWRKGLTLPFECGIGKQNCSGHLSFPLIRYSRWLGSNPKIAADIIASEGRDAALLGALRGPKPALGTGCSVRTASSGHQGCSCHPFLQETQDQSCVPWHSCDGSGCLSNISKFPRRKAAQGEAGLSPENDLPLGAVFFPSCYHCLTHTKVF